MKASLIPPDPPLVGKAPTLSLMCLYQRSQTSFEAAVGTHGRIQPGDAGFRRVQHWEQQLGLSTQHQHQSLLLPGLNEPFLRGQWQQFWWDAESAHFREWRGAAEWDRRAGAVPWTLGESIPELMCLTGTGISSTPPFHPSTLPILTPIPNPSPFLSQPHPYTHLHPSPIPIFMLTPSPAPFPSPPPQPHSHSYFRPIPIFIPASPIPIIILIPIPTAFLSQPHPYPHPHPNPALYLSSP